MGDGRWEMGDGRWEMGDGICDSLLSVVTVTRDDYDWQEAPPCAFSTCSLYSALICPSSHSLAA